MKFLWKTKSAKQFEIEKIDNLKKNLLIKIFIKSTKKKTISKKFKHKKAPKKSLRFSK